MYALRKKYGLDADEVSAPAVEDWLGKTAKLIRGGWPPELAGRITAEQVFKSFGDQRGVEAITVEEIFESAVEYGVTPERVGGRVIGEKGMGVEIGAASRISRGTWGSGVVPDEVVSSGGSRSGE